MDKKELEEVLSKLDLARFNVLEAKTILEREIADAERKLNKLNKG